MRINKLITLECMMEILNKFNFKRLYLILEIHKLNGIDAIKLFLRKISTVQYSTVQYIAIHFFPPKLKVCLSKRINKDELNGILKLESN